MTRLYLDVDGVINANFNASPWSKEGRRVGTATIRHDDNGKPFEYMEQCRQYQIMWSADMIGELNRLIDGGLEVIWLTTWRQDADESIAPLVGLPTGMRVLHPIDGVTEFPSICWKHEALARDLKNYGGMAIWADDEVISFGDVVFRDDEDGIDLGVRALNIDPNYGLTREHINTIEAFMRQEAVTR